MSDTNNPTTVIECVSFELQLSDNGAILKTTKGALGLEANFVVTDLMDSEPNDMIMFAFGSTMATSFGFDESTVTELFRWIRKKMGFDK